MGMQTTDAPLYDYIFDTAAYIDRVAKSNPDDVIGSPLASVFFSVLSDWENDRGASQRTVERCYQFCLIYRTAIEKVLEEAKEDDSTST